jgi:hypothetical protein
MRSTSDGLRQATATSRAGDFIAALGAGGALLPVLLTALRRAAAPIPPAVAGTAGGAALLPMAPHPTGHPVGLTAAPATATACPRTARLPVLAGVAHTVADIRRRGAPALLTAQRAAAFAVLLPDDPGISAALGDVVRHRIAATTPFLGLDDGAADPTVAKARVSSVTDTDRHVGRFLTARGRGMAGDIEPDAGRTQRVLLTEAVAALVIAVIAVAAAALALSDRD